MFKDYLNKAQELVDRGEPFVIALVVGYEAPISGKPGYRAIVTQDGNIWGWIAGGCSQSIIVEESLEVMKTGKPRLIKITPDMENDNPNHRQMSCHSGGTLEVYLEPVVPKPHIIIMGISATASSLCRLSKAMEYQVTALGPASDKFMPEADSCMDSFDVPGLSATENTFVVVVTQGEGDEVALEAALKINAPYCAFVASKKKAQAVFRYLQKKNFTKEQIKSVKAPAGLDIKATRPEEIALSILAEVVMAIRQRDIKLQDTGSSSSETAVDPICGMNVKIDGAKHTSSYKDDTYYFCCAGCKMAFETDPEKHLSAKGA
ncbi:MAG: XdhC family protein [Cyclobacteriaceae bacterium]|nr:XdhC family protein [Cyclobacteriaceae bacterium]